MGYILESNILNFEIDEYGKYFRLYSEINHIKTDSGSDFWRMMVDDGVYRELTIKSSEQKGFVSECKNGLCIAYDSLIAVNGSTFDISLNVYIHNLNGRFTIYSEIENRDKARVNEMQMPYFWFDMLCNLNKREDVLYYPNGLGEKIENPWQNLRVNHTEYMSADYNQIMYSMTYPSPLGMCWFGVESGNNFFYIGKRDTKLCTHALSVGTTPRNCEEKLIMAASSYPLAAEGEKVKTPVFEFGLLKGDWRSGSDVYGEYARKNWYSVPEKPQWVKNITGWQRIILKHQYGEIFFKYDDLPKIYEEGAKYGLNMLLVFGWWKGRFDNGYPCYEPDEALGGAEKLKAAIMKIHEMGGRVALYSNGVLIDVKSDFYNNVGKAICRKDIDGNEYREHYQFSNDGTVLKLFGYKSFVSACHATNEWHDKLLDTGKIKLSFNPDSVFYDQIGGHQPVLCFDESHMHGKRGDSELEWNIRNFKDIRKLCTGDKAFGTEFAIDVYAPYVDYHHGCSFGNYPAKNVFPEMFLRTFPEPIQSDRYLHDNREGFRDHLNYAFVYGFIFDISVYRGRKKIISDIPEYAEYIKYLIDLKDKYYQFFYKGKVVAEHKWELPKGIRAVEHRYDDKLMIAVANETDEKISVDFEDRKIEIAAHDVCCFILGE